VTVASTEIQVVVTTPPEDEDLVVSFGVQGGMPSVETYLGTSVRPENSLNLDTAQLAFVQLPPSEDLDAIHYREESLIFSSTTGVFLKGTQFFPSDLIEFDGFNFNLAFDGSLLGPGENIDAVTELDNGNLLISTATGASLFGFSFDDGDVVEVDLGNSTASLYMGLDEATLFTGTNQNIDALHFDPDTGNLLISVLIGGGTGTIGGLAYDASDNISTDVIELDLSGGVSASILQEGDGLYDGQTRQLDAVYVPEPSVAAALAAGAALVVILSRRRGARRAA